MGFAEKIEQDFRRFRAAQIRNEKNALTPLGDAPELGVQAAPGDGKRAIRLNLPGVLPGIGERAGHFHTAVMDPQDLLQHNAEVLPLGRSAAERARHVMNRNQLCVVPPKSSETEQKSPVSLHIIFGFSQARTATQSTPYPVPNEMPLEDQDELSLSPKQLAWPRYLLWRRPQW